MCQSPRTHPLGADGLLRDGVGDCVGLRGRGREDAAADPGGGRRGGPNGDRGGRRLHLRSRNLKDEESYTPKSCSIF